MTKTLTYAALTALCCFGSSCKKDDSTTNNKTQACSATAKIVKTITNAAGVVSYNATLGQYVVAVHQPGTYDSVDMGVVCGTLPAALQQAGTKVTVSGTFREYGQLAPAPTPAGTTYYYLDVSSIQ